MNRKELLEWIDTVPEDEPIFPVRAQDQLAPDTIAKWLGHAEHKRVNAQKIQGVKTILTEFLDWRQNNPGKAKLPD